MAAKISSFSGLIQRVTASCLLHPLSSGRHGSYIEDKDELYEYDSDENENAGHEQHEEEEEEDGEVELEEVGLQDIMRKPAVKKGDMVPTERAVEMEMLMYDVFHVISSMKKAYVSLQDAHHPWDAEKMRAADVAVVGELRKLGVLRERFTRSLIVGGFGGWRRSGGGMGVLREVLAPYEASVAELKKEVKARTVEVDELKEKISYISSNSGNGGMKGKSKRKVGCSHPAQSAIR